MQQNGTAGVGPGLKRLVSEASRALARLDADRLEELAQSCRALSRDLALDRTVDAERLKLSVREAENEMAVFERVLQVTRANAAVMKRLRELRAGRLEYREEQSVQWQEGERRHGDD